jgi:hypothetical protein
VRAVKSRARDGVFAGGELACAPNIILLILRVTRLFPNSHNFLKSLKKPKISRGAEVEWDGFGADNKTASLTEPLGA